jgi:hypothetical protein
LFAGSFARVNGSASPSASLLVWSALGSLRTSTPVTSSAGGSFSAVLLPEAGIWQVAVVPLDYAVEFPLDAVGSLVAYGLRVQPAFTAASVLGGNGLNVSVTIGNPGPFAGSHPMRGLN